ncbi:MAG: DUF6351 family protein [Pseudomonadota bacterium]
MKTCFPLIAAALVLACSAAGAEQVSPEQYPFICRTQESGLGQPLVDNQQGIGHPVFDNVTHEVVGHSSSCSVRTRFDYFYYTGTHFKPYSRGDAPADLKTARLNGATVPFIVRVEVGTINRFMYTIAMLAPLAEAPGALNNSAWNHKLVYWLRGGVGIGHQQGTAMWLKNNLNSSERELMPRLLEQGYAVVSSSGNETGVHYNIGLAERTAFMTKQHFAEAYGKPAYTIGIGGSGGAVQQYLFAQNRPGLLDGGIPIQSYPDMITQTIPIADCPLLGQYFKDEVALNPASPWSSWSHQTLIEGMNASDTVRNAMFNTPGTTECINGWRMAMPTVLNPQYKDPRFDLGARAYGYPATVFANVKWTHWNDLAEVYGSDSKGYAPVTVDNVGVQYGLAALAQGKIDADEFLRINACVGGWKAQSEFVAWNPSGDPYDARNMLRSANCRDPDGSPAPRQAGSVAAMNMAYSAGQVFTGQRLGIPMIDLRPYLEPELNMHNARQSFSVRARLLASNPGEAQRQVIWFRRTDADLVGAVMDAVAVLDRYLVGGSAPPEFVDKCVDAKGALIGAGPGVWDGILNQKPAGACTSAFPLYGSPRMVAGDSVKGDTFKCALKPVARALSDGSYPAGVQFTPRQQDWLNRIFPNGVCDYSQADQGRPPGL